MISRSTIWASVRPRSGLASAALIAVFIFAAYALITGGYLVSIVGFAAIYTIFVTGLNFFMGYTGQVSFGQNAFAAIGGYTSAILTAEWGWTPVAAMVLAMSASCLAAILVGLPALRLRGHHLAMATMALGLITYEVSVEWSSVTQGYMGISGIPPLGLFGFQLTGDRQQAAALLAIALACIWVTRRLTRSRYGIALASIAGNEDAARALGINVLRYKLSSFVYSALLASLAGSCFAHFVGFISPEVFGLNMVVLAFTMLYVGGIGSYWGPIVGAFAIGLLPELLRQFKDLQDLFYGAALIAILIFAPRGIAARTA